MLTETIDFLRDLSITNDTIIVSYSGGKDSLVVLDLAKRVFRNIKAFYMYLVPNMEYSDKIIEYAKLKFDIDIYQVFHWCYFKFKKNGIYCLPVKNMKDIKLHHIYALIRKELGDYPILHGGKRSDSQWRQVAKHNSKQGEYSEVYYPIYDWNKWDVLSYLSSREITIPETGNEKGTAFGVDLSTKSLDFVKDTFDRTLIEDEFPFIEAYYKRNEWYG